MKKRKQERFVRRLEVEFSAHGKNYRGISSDLSRNGLFIRTNHAFAAGSLLEILLYLPDGTSCRLKGFVRRALKTPVVSIKNGMGLELTETDDNYTKFIDGFSNAKEGAGPSDTGAERSYAQGRVTDIDEYVIVGCAHCNTKNKVYRSRMMLSHKCGKCGHPLVCQD